MQICLEKKSNFHFKSVRVANELMVSYGSSRISLGGKIKTGIDKVSARRSVRLRECPLAEILSREIQRVDCIRIIHV